MKSLLRARNHRKAALLMAVLLCFTAMTILAQQISGIPGSPGATTRISNKQLLPLDPK